ncbi:DUF2513 domain-containing protein [Pseudomonas sp. PCH199]|uniref:DUF2513 domain-containing protein n=1 Tax=unclassified Pseudomonas TaxID=196821 RepID=UPI000BC7C73C|nr:MULTISPECIES: DUF2513 domain-containing protein [unclassified Pseudomonas]MCW8278933.1 DUF2513 domain-containing protein [Pseudomonas sp. PCH199]PAM79766.1 hypothetical protein CES87_28955 [Pseudomonas sp. ERMR1:02]
MRRDMNLIRLILKRIEDLSDSGNFYAMFPEYVENFQIKQDCEAQFALAFKHLNLLIISGFVDGDEDRTGNVRGLTWEGHNLLDRIRDAQL